MDEELLSSPGAVLQAANQGLPIVKGQKPDGSKRSEMLVKAQYARTGSSC